MRDKDKTKNQLIDELLEIRKTLDKLKKSKNEIQKTEKRLHEKLFEYEKLSALGRLTANVAHEIRNPITVIGGLAKRLKKSTYLNPKEKEYPDLIFSEAKRLEEILSDVLLFSNKPFFMKEELDINKIVEDIFRKHQININKHFGNVTKLYIDKKQFKDAMHNLILNAIDAMPDGGTLTISTDDVSLNGKNYVIIKVTDTGVGIPEENIRMIFEPFFTTKVTKKETGLGLPITKKIVEGHGGFISVESVVGKGSSFILHFPYRSK
jgi:signal transduction histidine kinase